MVSLRRVGDCGLKRVMMGEMSVGQVVIGMRGELEGSGLGGW